MEDADGYSRVRTRQFSEYCKQIFGIVVDATVPVAASEHPRIKRYDQNAVQPFANSLRTHFAWTGSFKNPLERSVEVQPKRKDAASHSSRDER